MLLLTNARAQVRAHAWLLIFAFVITWFSTLNYRALADPDEGRYAQIPREMTLTGDWVTPRVNTVKYLEKPPLQYWATAIAFTAFGEHEWTVRLWPALTGFAGIVLTLFAGVRLFDRETGRLAALVLGSSFWYLGFSHIATLDMGLSFFLNLALFAFLFAQQANTAASARRAWMLVAWAATGLALLSKGLIALLLPGLAVFLYCLVHRDFSVLRRLSPLAGASVLLVIAAPWFIAVSRANPEFAAFFFLHEHFGRFLTTTHERAGPLWYYIPVLMVGSLPWIGFLLVSPRRSWRDAINPRCIDPSRFLWLWCGSMFVFFSVSGSKLPVYVLPMFPALCLLLARAMQRSSAQQFARRVWVSVLLAIALVIAAPWAPLLARDNQPSDLLAAYAPWLMAAGAALLLCAVVALALRHRIGLLAAVVALAIGGTLFGQLILNGFEALSPANSAREIAAKLRPLITENTVLYSVGLYDHTLPFYLKRNLILVQFPDEFAPGLRAEPSRWIAQLAEFAAIWPQQADAIAVMPADVFRRLGAQGLPMTTLMITPSYVVVSSVTAGAMIRP